MELCSSSDHSRWVCFFVGTDLEKCSIKTLAHQWILCNKWVLSELESKQLKKTLQYYTTSHVKWKAACLSVTSKYQSVIHNTSSSAILACKQCLICAYFSRFKRDEFFMGESNIMDKVHIFRRKQWCLKLKTSLWWIWFLQKHSFNWIMNWSSVDCYIFIKCLNSHSNGTHSLQISHWSATDGMLNFSKSILMKKQTYLYASQNVNKIHF